MTDPNVPEDKEGPPYWSDYSPEYKEFDEPNPFRPEGKTALIAASLFVLLVLALALIEAFN